ncbi:MAG TPA: hypothetical protein VME43_15185 [Bryobacteraceae bacterium]|nr:hypothetical protein [Bryobacteraceae bacterium]
MTADNPQPKRPSYDTLDTELMELAHPNILKAGYRPAAQLAMPAAPATFPRRAISKRCQCGQCAACRDNARWERIFQEKFADPTYYTLRPLSQKSSLYGLE